MKFKTLFRSAVVAALVVLTAFTVPSAPAAPLDELSAWGVGGTDVSTTLCYSVVSTFSRIPGGGTPMMTYVNATSDKAGSVIQFYTAGSPVQCNFTNSTVTIPVTSTNGFNFSSGVIVIRHYLTDTYERRVLTTSTGSTNLVVTSAPGTTTIPGDQIWPMTTAGSIPVGSATKELNGGSGIYAGQRAKPFLFEIDGTSACQINAAGGTYLP